MNNEKLIHRDRKLKEMNVALLDPMLLPCYSEPSDSLINELASSIRGYNLAQKREALACVVSNIANADGWRVAVQAKGYAECTDRRAFELYHPYATRANMNEAYSILERTNRVVVLRGSYIRSRLTELTATPKFIEELKACGKFDVRAYRGAIIRGEDKSLIVKKGIHRRIERMEEINGMKPKLSHAGANVGTELRQVFSRTMKRGGRLYGLGGNSYQRMNSAERKELTMEAHNGKTYKMCELDYVAMQPSLLYSMKGVRLYGDVYASFIVRKKKVPREVTKALFVCSIGSSRDDANYISCAAANLLRRKGHGELFGETLDRLGVTRNILFGLFKRNYSEISEFFGVGIWAKLQNIESEIMLRVLDRLASYAIVGLPLHDSCLVVEQHKGLLQEIMEQCYMDETGGFTCDVREK